MRSDSRAPSPADPFAWSAASLPAPDLAGGAFETKSILEGLSSEARNTALCCTRHPQRMLACPPILVMPCAFGLLHEAVDARRNGDVQRTYYFACLFPLRPNFGVARTSLPRRCSAFYRPEVISVTCWLQTVNSPETRNRDCSHLNALRKKSSLLPPSLSMKTGCREANVAAKLEWRRRRTPASGRDSILPGRQ